MSNFITFENTQIAVIHLDGQRWLNGDHVLRVLYGRVKDKHYQGCRSMLPPQSLLFRDVETETGTHREFLMSYWAALILAIKTSESNAAAFRDFFVNVIEADLKHGPEADANVIARIMSLETRLEKFMALMADRKRIGLPLLSRVSHFFRKPKVVCQPLTPREMVSHLSVVGGKQTGCHSEEECEYGPDQTQIGGL